MSFLCSCVLLLVVFLALCIFFVYGVGFVYMCCSLADWVRLCFGFVFQFVYICVLFSALVHFIMLSILSCVSSAPNEETVRFRSMGVI